MHTFVATKGTRFHHNSDGSGDVHIWVGDWPAYHDEAIVPFDDLLQFVEEVVRRRVIDELQQAEKPFVPPSKYPLTTTTLP